MPRISARSSGMLAALALGVALLAAAAARRDVSPQPSGPVYGLGRPATAEDIRRWDTEVGPDGAGLPAGRGTVTEGAKVYAQKCAACHGATGAEGPMDKLVDTVARETFAFGRDATLAARRTIGNYWPHATTVYDYINRAMPFDKPGSLTPNEVYAVTAFLLHRNAIVPANAVMDATTLRAVRMPARDKFVRDDRAGGREVR